MKDYLTALYLLIGFIYAVILGLKARKEQGDKGCECGLWPFVTVLWFPIILIKLFFPASKPTEN